MLMAVKASTDINLAVYMERLDSYIANQATLNETLCLRLEKHGEELDEIQSWRTKFYGAKWVTGALGILALHTTVVLTAILGMIRWIK
tara:strand:+ start:988 stop:1251 length:264 start_codon:yes stop_codon:yes gene_type:complete